MANITVKEYGPMNWCYYSGECDAVFDLSDGSTVQYAFNVEVDEDEEVMLENMHVVCDHIKERIELGLENDYLEDYAEI